MQVQEGEGWRWLVDPGRHPFPVLVGGQDWAVELTADEARGLQEGLVRLVQEHHGLVDQLMPEETISLELERGPLWMALEGDREVWQLRFVLTPASQSRAVEGSWRPEASVALVAALVSALAQNDPS
ncbi:DUF1818 family protein [Cyanobium sp. Aljojuca 7D2]|uniref:DUF1818 family protein n=1 Tax=Cyanobium sp. Aljojuca 7D2 TaxID=2823698 RepID=UPI0020CD9E3B|nr:DUF1818 family protein [Cyanobium sp. Aljojuca 7D2]MCP9891294.1 DUF1818 family protein [Cyanobium sp. Aljojuca 7D2]